MKSMMKRTTMREIKSSFGRFFAILAIVALGVGFFSGLKITKQAMITTVNEFLNEKNFFDLHLLSTLGFDDEDVNAFSEEEQVEYAEGICLFDTLYTGIGENEVVLKTISVPENINGIRLVDGRMPETETECVIDSKLSDIEIGDTICLAQTNEEDTLSVFAEEEFTVVGTVESSYYINFERGTTSLGNGKVSGFVYVIPEVFICDYYTDVFICFENEYEIYSGEYDDFMEMKLEAWEDICKERVDLRYETLVEELQAQLETAQSAYIEGLESGNKDISQSPDLEALQSAYEESLPDVDFYVLDRSTNIGYACFESDSDIVDAIAKVFPVFFILVAALVCMTTMNRMVEEQRTQIGVLKALGYGKASIMGKFMFYSGSAALIGCVIGYVAGIYVFPEVIWTAYHLMYVNLDLIHVFNWELAVIAISVSLICSIGTTWLSCRYELGETAASLMRAKAPKAGKRVLLERIPFIWKRLKFLHKVSIRNIFRYKKRFFMMIIGICGCTALLLTGFGIKDSIAGFAEQQYGEIQVADGAIGLKEAMNSETENSLTEKLDAVAENYAYASETTWDLVVGKNIKSINMVVMEKPEMIDNYMKFYTEDDEAIDYPSNGEAVINNAIADLYDISIGDTVIIRDADMREIRVNISGIFMNHVYNYIFISPETFYEQLGEIPEYNTIYVNFQADEDIHQAAAEIMQDNNVAVTTINQDTEERLSKMMSSLNYVVLLVIICAAALAFIVLYNLTNINITERIREIATIKVLGFFRNETSAYVFRENIVLTSFGILVGLILGIFLHRFVMAQIHVDMVYFDAYIEPLSYLYSIVLTFIFNFGVNRVMAVKLECINMAESLKSVD